MPKSSPVVIPDPIYSRYKRAYQLGTASPFRFFFGPIVFACYRASKRKLGPFALFYECERAINSGLKPDTEVVSYETAFQMISVETREEAIHMSGMTREQKLEFLEPRYKAAIQRQQGKKLLRAASADQSTLLRAQSSEAQTSSEQLLRPED